MARPVVRQAEQGPRSAADRAMPASARLRCAPAHRSGLPPTKRDDDSTKAHRAPADCFGYSRSSLVNSYSPDAAAMSWRCQYQKQKSIMAKRKPVSFGELRKTQALDHDLTIFLLAKGGVSEEFRDRSVCFDVKKVFGRCLRSTEASSEGVACNEAAPPWIPKGRIPCRLFAPSGRLVVLALKQESVRKSAHRNVSKDVSGIESHGVQ
jgi:hypothetical protein